MSFDRKIAGLIDHTILRPDATRADVRRVCEEALKYGFASVCVNSFWVPQVARELGGSSVKVCTVAGFPLGAVSTAAQSDILAVVRVSHDNGALVKVIIETALLNDEQKRLACQLSADAGADFVKTSTGFAKLGATAADIALMRAAVGPVIGVKASGGIRTLEDLRRMVAAGATRVGASASVAIIEATRPESENAAAS